MHGLIGIDWGTSHLRAYLLDDDGAVLERRARPWGLRQLPEGGFDAALADLVQGWPAAPRLAAGMVGSRNGWREVPYLDLPADAAAIAAALSSVQAADGRPLHLVPGLRDPAGPNVMRGEETQIVGALALRPALAARATLLLPGTHSKWAQVRDGAVVRFHTAMTGELYALLRRHSILGAGLPDTVPDAPDAFQRGVRAARDSGPAGALSALFSTRALMLDGALASAAVPDYLSGLLIGEELRAALAAGWATPGEPLQLVGDAALCARYAAAAESFGLHPDDALESATAQGLWHIAGAAGLCRTHPQGVSA